MDEQILQKVGMFYEMAWDKLIITGTIGIGVVGIVMPLVVQWWQRRILQIEKKELLNQLRTELTTYIDSKLSKDLDAIRHELDKGLKNVRANTLHLQSVVRLSQGHITESIGEAITCSSLYIASGDLTNLPRILGLIENGLLSITKADFERLKETNDIDIEEFF